MVLKAIVTEAKNKNSIKLDDVYVEVVKKLPEDIKVIGWMTKKTVSGNPDGKDYIYVGNAGHELRTKNPNVLLYRRKTYLQALDEEGTVRYVGLYVSNLPFLILLLLLLLFLLFLLRKPASVGTPIITEGVEGQTDQENESTDPEVKAVGTITYTSPAIENSTWNADTKEQTFTIINPAGNTDDLAPHVYIDLNGDGTFSEDECVFNPITYDENGNVSSYGGFIAPGRQIDTVTLTRKIPAGTYNAKIAYTAVDISTKTLDNPMAFDFTVTVE